MQNNSGTEKLFLKAWHQRHRGIRSAGVIGYKAEAGGHDARGCFTRLGDITSESATGVYVLSQHTNMVWAILTCVVQLFH